MSDRPASPEAAPAATTNGASSAGDSSKKQNGTKKDGAAPAAKPELSGAEKKRLAKAEKAAKRAKDRQEPEQTATEAASSGAASASSQPPESTPKARTLKQGKPATGVTEKQAPHKRAGSNTASKSDNKQLLPVHPRRPSQSGPTPNPLHAQPQPHAASSQKAKQVPFFSHLYAHPRRYTLSQTTKEVHPSIQTLALQTTHYRICGSQARTISTLLALKTVIATYTTPHGTSLPRHLSSAFLSPQLAHLKSHGRPFSTAQSAAVRWLKNCIATLDPGLPEQIAKTRILMAVDAFIRDRFTVADQVIAAEVAANWIRDGDVVLVYGKSAVVMRCLREAVRRGRRFKVICADARPLHEGRAMARSLCSLRPRDPQNDPPTSNPQHTATDDTDNDDDTDNQQDPTLRTIPPRPSPGIETTYTSLTSLGATLTTTPATKCLLGAHTVLANGAVQSRAGTALVALLARTDCAAPVLFVAESVKFAERVAVDSCGSNELGGEDELVATSLAEDAGGGGAEKGDEGSGLGKWRDVQNLALLNPMYDVTPPKLVDALVTEVGTVAASGAAVVGRLAMGVGEGGVV